MTKLPPPDEIYRSTCLSVVSLMMMNDDDLKRHGQSFASLWFEGMPRHGDGNQHSDEIKDGRTNERRKENRTTNTRTYTGPYAPCLTTLDRQALFTHTSGRRTHDMYTLAQHVLTFSQTAVRTKHHMKKTWFMQSITRYHSGSFAVEN